MSTEEHFTWLHLTDLHYGQLGQGPLWSNVRKSFFRDLKRMRDRSGPLNAVLFTGDLVFSGKAQEFKELEEEVLPRLWDLLASIGSENAVLLAVPGNHDLMWPPRNTAAVRQLKRENGFYEIENEFWEKKNGEYRRVCSSSLVNYQAWWSQTQFKKNSPLQEGLLPGDFSTTLKVGSHRIGIVGLNTTFLQLSGEDYKKRLALNVRQMNAVCGTDVADWLEEHEVALLLTHQGPDWLDSNSYEEHYPEINPAGQFAAHLFGHMHETVYQATSYGGGKAVRHWQSYSLFGLDKFGQSAKMRRNHGYSIGRITFGLDNSLRFWPRRAVRDNNGWRFVADSQGSILADDEGTRSQIIDRAGPIEISSEAQPVLAEKVEEKIARGYFQALLERFVPDSIFAEIKGLLMIDMIKTDCDYHFTFKGPNPSTPPGYFVLRRELRFTVTNLTNKDIVFPIRSAYSSDEDLQSGPWRGEHFHVGLAVDGADIPLKEGVNLLNENGVLVLEENVTLEPRKPKPIFLNGEEPFHSGDGRAAYIQGSPAVGIRVSVKNEIPEQLGFWDVRFYHPGADELIRTPDSVQLTRAFLPGQGFEIFWKFREPPV